MIKKITTYITPFQLERTLHIALPDNYYETQVHYPVMYMYDGHNLFQDHDATYGKSWGLEDFLNDYDKPFIIVGIECNHEGQERLNEFSPYTFDNSYFGHINGKGEILMDWVIVELKPFIDEHYRTIPFRECTGIGGSSMGGLMALYTVIKYNIYFSKAACLSSAISMCMPQLKNELQEAFIDSDTRVYMSFGTKEVRGKKGIELMKNNLNEIEKQFYLRGASFHLNIIKNGQHNEASWEKENKVYFDYLWK